MTADFHSPLCVCVSRVDTALKGGATRWKEPERPLGRPAIFEPPLMLSAVVFLSYWLGLLIWTYRDTKAHGEPALLWGALVLVTNFVELLTY